MVILVHIKTVAQDNRAYGQNGLIGQVVLLHVVLELVFRVESEQEMMHVLKKVFKLKIVMVPVTLAVERVNRGQNGEHAMLHVVLELKVEVVRVALILDALMLIKLDHVMLVSHVLRLVAFVVCGVNGVIAVSVVVRNQNQEHEHAVLEHVKNRPNNNHVTQMLLLPTSTEQ